MPAMAKRSPLEGESLMLILHPVFLIATLAHLLGWGAKRAWQVVTGQQRADIVEANDKGPQARSLSAAHADKGALSEPVAGSDRQ